MKLSVIIPAYNEENTIAYVVMRIFALRLDLDFEVIIVDDGSTDATAEEVKRLGLPVVYIRQEKNLGKGMALKRESRRPKEKSFLYKMPILNTTQGLFGTAQADFIARGRGGLWLANTE